MTTYPRLIYDNFWRKGGNALAASPTADPQHPVSDTQIDTKSMYFKASAKTSPCTIPMDLGAGTRSINFIAILGHNIPNGVTIKFQEDDDGDTFPSPTDTPNFTWQATNIFEFLATPLTERYVRLHLTNGGSDFATEPQIATILCGKYVEFNRRPIKGYTLGKEDITEIEESDSRVIFAQEKAVLDEYRYMFEGLDDTTKTAILAFLEECRKNRAFVWCTNYKNPNSNSNFVRNSEIIYPVFQYPNFWNWELAMKEIV